MRELSPDNHTEAEWQQMREWHKHGDEQIRALWRLPEVLKDSYTDMNFTPPYLSTIKPLTLIVHGDRDYNPASGAGTALSLDELACKDFMCV